MKARIVLKSFPGHKGIPGHQGGSLPDDAVQSARSSDPKGRMAANENQEGKDSFGTTGKPPKAKVGGWKDDSKGMMHSMVKTVDYKGTKIQVTAVMNERDHPNDRAWAVSYSNGDRVIWGGNQFDANDTGKSELLKWADDNFERIAAKLVTKPKRSPKRRGPGESYSVYD